MAQKFDLPNSLVSELVKFNELFLKGLTRTTTGNLSFTSTSSTETYNSTTGEEGLLTLLKTALIDYMVTATDFNNKLEASDVANKVNNLGDVPSFQSGLDVEKPVASTLGEIYIATDTKKIYRDTGTAWETIGISSTISENFTTQIQTEVDANDIRFSGTKKADTLCWSGQCIYATTSTSGTVVLTNITIDTLRFLNYVLNIRLKSANNLLSTNAILVDIQKNVSGTFTSIATNYIKANEFANVTDYQVFQVNFDYKGVKATNNQIKIVVTLQTQTSVYEVDLDSIIIMPVGLGAFIA